MKLWLLENLLLKHYGENPENDPLIRLDRPDGSLIKAIQILPLQSKILLHDNVEPAYAFNSMTAANGFTLNTICRALSELSEECGFFDIYMPSINEKGIRDFVPIYMPSINEKGIQDFVPVIATCCSNVSDTVWLEQKGWIDIGEELQTRYDECLCEEINRVKKEFYNDLAATGFSEEDVCIHLGNKIAEQMHHFCQKPWRRKEAEEMSQERCLELLHRVVDHISAASNGVDVASTLLDLDFTTGELINEFGFVPNDVIEAMKGGAGE